jgi:hypothetical protein
MKNAKGTVFIAGISCVAVAGAFGRDAAFSYRDIGEVAAFEDAGEQTPSAVVVTYDNYTLPTLLDADYRVGGDEVGDDLVLTSGGGIIDSAGFSMVNMSANDNLTGLRAVFRWYDSDTEQLLGSFTLNGDFPRNIVPGERIRIKGEEGTLRMFGIPVAPRMFHTTEFLEVRGIDLADVGMTYGGPHNVGSSSRFARNFTTGETIDLGGADENFGYLIRTWPVPAPGTLAAAAGAVALGFRRRRGD